MELEVFKINGSLSGEKVKLSSEVFGIEPNQHLIYEAVRSYLANQRQGTHKTKTRGEVAGSGKKLWKQKGTGRARMGSVRSPLWKGGGTMFGPQPRDYSITLPLKMRHLAKKSALSLKAKEFQIKVVEDFSFDLPKTKQMSNILNSLNLKDKKVLLVTPLNLKNIVLSGRNMLNFKILEAYKISTYEILNNDILLLQRSSIKPIEDSFGGKQ